MKYLTLLSFVLFNSLQVSSQTTWAPPGAVWHYVFMMNNYSNFHELSFTVVGDTMINEKKCSIIEITTDSGVTAGWWGCNIPGENKEIMYEESGRVYYYNQGGNNFNLLYDFSKQSGESWKVPLCSEAFQTIDTLLIEVDSIKDLSFGSKTVKTHYVKHNSNSFVIYEGLGCATNMFYYHSDNPSQTLNFAVLNLCSYNSPTTGFIEFDNGWCSEISAIPEKQANASSSVIIYPNPANSYIRISISPMLNHSAIFLFFDSLGRTLMQTTLLPQPNEYEMNLPNLTPGIYFWNIRSEKGQAKCGKIVVER